MGVAFWIMPVLCIQYFCVSEYMVCQLNDGSSCPAAICSNTTLNFICNIETQQLGYTVWLLPNGTCLDKSYTDRIGLLQPKYVGCNPSSSSQHGTCGPFSAQTVATSGCVNSSLSVVATQELNGAEIKCMNYNGRNYSLIGNTTLSVIGEPHPPNISVISGCTDIEVQWTSPPIGDQLTGVTISVKNEAGIVQSEGVPLPWNTNSMIFHNLMSDSYYYIIYQVSNCAGIDEVTTPTWTLPRPPQGIQASHVINSTAHSMNLVVTWTNQLQPSINRSYILNISFEDSQIVKSLQVSMDYCNSPTGVCYFTKVFSNISIVKCYISMASVSGPRIGPFSAQVESVEISLTSATCTTTTTYALCTASPYSAAVPFSAIGTAVGASISITFVISFSMGVLVASVLCYISRSPKQSSHKPSSHVDPTPVYDEVGTSRKTKGDMEMRINESYSTLY